MKEFYAIHWGQHSSAPYITNKTEVHRFDSARERDEFVAQRTTEDPHAAGYRHAALGSNEVVRKYQRTDKIIVH